MYVRDDLFLCCYYLVLVVIWKLIGDLFLWFKLWMVLVGIDFKYGVFVRCDSYFFFWFFGGVWECFYEVILGLVLEDVNFY